MGNCLLTMLNDSVHDESLIKLGHYRGFWKANSPLGSVLTIATNGNAEIVEGDAYFTDSTGSQNYGKSTSSINNRLYVITNTNFCIDFDNKYTTNYMVGIADIEDYRYSNSGIVSATGAKPVVGNLDVFKGKNALRELTLGASTYKTQISGKVEDVTSSELRVITINAAADCNVSFFDNKTKLIRALFFNVKFEGDLLSALGKLITLEVIQIGSNCIVESPFIDETLADLMVSNGRTSGRCQFRINKDRFFIFTSDRETYPRGWYVG